MRRLWLPPAWPLCRGLGGWFKLVPGSIEQPVSADLTVTCEPLPCRWPFAKAAVEKIAWEMLPGACKGLVLGRLGAVQLRTMKLA